MNKIIVTTETGNEKFSLVFVDVVEAENEKDAEKQILESYYEKEDLFREHD